MSRLQQYTTTGFSHYGPPHSISHIHCIFSSFSHSLLLQVFFVLYIIQPPTAVTYYLVRHTSSLSTISRLTHHITSLFSYFPSCATYHLPFSAISRLAHHLPFSAITRLTQHITSPFQLFPVLHITSSPFFSYFPYCTSHHLLFSAISRLTHHIISFLQLFPVLHITSLFQLFPVLHITSLFQLFPVLHITSPPFFSYFPSCTSHHLPFSAISRLAHHIISFLQQFPALHITSLPFLSYFPSCTSHHLPSSAISCLTQHVTSSFSHFQSDTPDNLLLQLRSISHLIRHFVTHFFSSFPSYTTRLSIQTTYDTNPVRNFPYALQSPFHAHEDIGIIESQHMLRFLKNKAYLRTHTLLHANTL